INHYSTDHDPMSFPTRRSSDLLANVANLYQMSLLAFSGLLGGLLKEGKKAGVSVGLLVGTFLIGIYGETSAIGPSFIESSIAIRSEEHTSELQSRFDLVCRLLL